MVRDAHTGRVVVQPPKHQWWLVREKSGLGRASKADWNIVSGVCDQMFEQLGDSMYSDYIFGFEDHYDVIVWDTLPGMHYYQMHDIIHTALVKAHRFRNSIDFYRPVESVIRTLHRDEETGRCRDVKPGEMSIWDDLKDPGSRMVIQTIDNHGQARDMTEDELHDTNYNDIDATEDAILFQEEREGHTNTAIGGPSDRNNLKIEETGPNWQRFIQDSDTDQESDSDFEEEFMERRIKKKTENTKGKQPRAQKKRKNKDEKVTKFGDAVLSNRNKDLLGSIEAATIRDHSWQGGPECPNGWAADCQCEACKAVNSETVPSDSALAQNMLGNSQGHEEDDSEWSDSSGDVGSDEEDDLCVEDRDLELVELDPVKLKILKRFVFSPDPEGRDTEKDSITHVDREKSKAFKPQWHAADWEPEAHERYTEMHAQLKTPMALNRLSRHERARLSQVLCWLNVHLSEHRLVFRDIQETFGWVGIFFPDTRPDSEDVGTWRRERKNKASWLTTTGKRSKCLMPKTGAASTLCLRNSGTMP